MFHFKHKIKNFQADKRAALTEKQLNELRTEFEEYRRERRINEDMLTEQIDKLMSQVRELTNDKLKLSTQAEFQSERFKALLANGSGQKAQITALEEKCKIYSETIAKHETSLKALMQVSACKPKYFTLVFKLLFFSYF